MGAVIRSLLVATLCLASASSIAGAQTPTDEYGAQSFYPAPGTDNYFMTDGGRIDGDVNLTGAVWVDYASRPLVVDTQCAFRPAIPCEVIDRETLDPEVDVVSQMFLVHLVGSLSFIEHFQLGFGVPLGFVDGDPIPIVEADGPNNAVLGGRGGGLGDIRLHAKIEIASVLAGRLNFAAAGFLTVPTGQLSAEGHYLGEASLTGGGHGIIEWRDEQFTMAINVGGHFRPSGELVATTVGQQLVYAVAMGFRVVPSFHVLAELYGGSSFGGPDEKLELRPGVRFAYEGFELVAGAGVGLVRGVGTPYYRFLASVGYVPRPVPDTDGDGLDDELDGCPDLAEDLDGFADEDGCPEPDNDEDGLPDAEDGCPDEPEDADGNADEDGCPDPDNDGDGVIDGYDSCPETPEDIDGDRDDDGCPDLDTDRDGIPDEEDGCPNDPEDTDGLADEDGCPETDVDQDGIQDDLDECPEEAEDLDGDADEDGCPD